MSLGRKILPSRRRRATVMVLVIWIILVLTVVAYSLAYEIRIGLKMTSQGRKRIRAQGLARAGLAHAVMDLRNDRLIAAADNTRVNDTLGDVWANLKDKIDVKYGGGAYSVLVVDEERKLNLNLLQPNSIGVLQYLLEDVGGMKKEIAETVSQAVLDYKDQDLFPIGGKGGNEIDFYTDWGRRSLRGSLPADWTFRPKNDVFLTLSELLNIPGITPDVLNGRFDKEIGDPFEQALEGGRKKASKALTDYLTVNGSGQVNINTCPVKLLEAILVGGAKNKTLAKWADKIDLVRQNSLRRRSSEGFGIDNTAYLVQEGVPSDVVGIIERTTPISTGSTTFTITSRGEFGGVRVTIQALVGMMLEPYLIDPANKRDRLRDPRAMGKLNNQLNMVIDPAVRVISISEY